MSKNIIHEVAEDIAACLEIAGNPEEDTIGSVLKMKIRTHYRKGNLLNFGGLSEVNGIFNITVCPKEGGKYVIKVYPYPDGTVLYEKIEDSVVKNKSFRIYDPNSKTLTYWDGTKEEFYCGETLDNLTILLLNYKGGSMSLQQTYSELVKAIAIGDVKDVCS